MTPPEGEERGDLRAEVALARDELRAALKLVALQTVTIGNLQEISDLHTKTLGHVISTLEKLLGKP